MNESSAPRVSLQAYMRSGTVQERIEALLKDRAPQFTTSLMSLINSNPVLQECKPESVLAAAITAASMDLPINPNLGFAYIIPYKNWKKELKISVYEAQFQMGWKGFVQLAQRSNSYKIINATDVRQTEYRGINRMTGEIELKWIKNEERRETLPVVGYLAFFRLHSGFEKMLYMSVEEMEAHAKKYSKAFASGFGMWVDDFGSMARKTAIKLLISRWGPMNTEMQKAILADQAVTDEDSFDYVDNSKDNKDENNDQPTTTEETTQDDASDE